MKVKRSSDKNTTNKLEKEILKNLIFESIDNHILNTWRIRYAIGTVASIILIVGLCSYYYNSPSESIIDFVKSSKKSNVNDYEDVLLILGEGENLKIEEEITTINYSSTGEKVTIGNTKKINQVAIKKNKTVYNSLLVPYGKRSKIHLSDGSTVWLNSGSKLIYPAVFNGDKREVYIEGEAVFDVKHNQEKPFIVFSENQETEVLGTVFGITNYLDENHIDTFLKSGSVLISYKDKSQNISTDKLKISPGTLASFNKETKSIISNKVNVDNYFSWIDGILIFKNNDLEFITKRLSRFYNIDITINDIQLKKETFSGYLNLNENINKVIQNIKESTNMEYTFNGNKIIISN
tara:strand:+ start:3361 stop:4410 length:1050 start_codon:yes stop_codon:yes gene_type:complete